MKIKFFLTACIAIFILSGCAKSDLSEDLIPEKETDVSATLRSNKKAQDSSISFSVPCPTALFAQNMPAGQSVIVYKFDGTVITTFTTTDYTPLETNSAYRFWIPLGADVTYCSCGENYGVLTIPSDNLLYTSSDPTSYSTCAF